MHEVEEASERAASLTRQLLAFSRKQIIEPKVVSSPNRLLGDLRKLLGTIDRRGTSTSNGSSTRIPPRFVWDPGQIEQVHRQFCVVNARDAMPYGGRLCIETGQTSCSNRNLLKRRFNLDGGKYVFISVQDNGHGMDEETASPNLRTVSSRPRETTKAPAWVWRRSSASSASIKEPSKWRASWKSARRSVSYLPDGRRRSAGPWKTVREMVELPPVKG